MPKLSNTSNRSRKILIKCEKLTKTYDDRSVIVKALQGIDLIIKENKFIAIIGSSGSGKTTLLNLIGGLDKPTSGKMWFDGEEISSLNKKEGVLFRRKVGIIFQDFNLHSVLTVQQNIELPMIYAEKLDKHARMIRVEDLIEKVGLEKRKRHIPTQLSSGEKQRVGIARALANNPKLILADQPTGNLDSKTGDKIIKLMKDLQKEFSITIIVVTHNLDVARKADRVFAIEDGKIIPVTLEGKEKKRMKKKKRKKAKAS